MSEQNTRRPSEYTEAIGTRILGELAKGQALKAVCAEAWAPRERTFFAWLREYPDLAARYVIAKEEAAEVFADEMITIADRDDLDPNDKKVRIETRKWTAAKLKPKKFGDRQQIDVHQEQGTAVTDPNELVTRLVTMGTQYPTLNPVIRKMAQDILDQLPEIKA